MKLQFACILLFLTVSYSNALTQSNGNAENALRECFKNMKVTINKQPNLDKIEECMSKKGYVKPFVRTADGKIVPKIKY